MSYCLSCKDYTKDENKQVLYDKKKDLYIQKSNCRDCGKGKSKFLKSRQDNETEDEDDYESEYESEEESDEESDDEFYDNDE